MRVFRQFILFAIILTGLSIVASAQSQGPDRPPKNPPVVDPGKKPTPTPQPTPPKKPGYSIVIWKESDLT
ncbi:MAG: hypothetical protein IT172_10765 [Acidobacteria bacterium]|nr:hypothetical protein [Acidobacteriota bacterium]